jgi:hypothetical protein
MQRHRLTLRIPILVWITLVFLACTATSAETSAPIGVLDLTDPPSRVGRSVPAQITVVTTPTLTPDATLALYPVWTRKYLCESNAYYAGNPLPGKTIRFQTPIDVNPNKVPNVLEAIRNYEAMTGGLVAPRSIVVTESIA